MSDYTLNPSELKPCPFCGNPRPEIRSNRSEGVMLWRVLCQDCNGRGGHGIDPKTAIDNWNARSWSDADLELLVSRVSELLKGKRQ